MSNDRISAIVMKARAREAKLFGPASGCAEEGAQAGMCEPLFEPKPGQIPKEEPKPVPSTPVIRGRRLGDDAATPKQEADDLFMSSARRNRLNVLATPAVGARATQIEMAKKKERIAAMRSEAFSMRYGFEKDSLAPSSSQVEPGSSSSGSGEGGAAPSASSSAEGGQDAKGPTQPGRRSNKNLAEQGFLSDVRPVMPPMDRPRTAPSVPVSAPTPASASAAESPKDKSPGGEGGGVGFEGRGSFRRPTKLQPSLGAIEEVMKEEGEEGDEEDERDPMLSVTKSSAGGGGGKGAASLSDSSMDNSPSPPFRGAASPPPRASADGTPAVPPSPALTRSTLQERRKLMQML
uniref:Uncharacterized protein n=1 Tax=Chromera velia CCMP2878 TaxID=1169474 RepID=A0A0G4HKT2_9ALVE|eukprot:Cvel_28571.t1-p1 / transcript=Cvel_28571.t1 / gene=Cvel_28571 / organism=Chromera_velia_CCMP2878 / gene_product=hypothetical protein / transcript_product=hypothetical protein / location=Cvel_scaffold3763:11041-13272(-) / protein_length=348 / sequence_SO=supercontig / SO=protein_coding / is_pseudo=false